MRVKLIIAAAAAATLLAGCVPEPGYGPGLYAANPCGPGWRLNRYGDCVRVYRPVYVAPEPAYFGPGPIYVGPRRFYGRRAFYGRPVGGPRRVGAPMRRHW